VPAERGIPFGNYVLLRRIARGGMAEVFLANQRGLEGFDRRVAIKRILPHLADSPDFVRMFLGEAKLAAQLAHPNIVHIYDFGKVDTDYFLAMEFVDGVHAGQLGKLDERLSPTMVARIGADAASALHYAHEQRNSIGQPLGLVHRDVSPANLMVSFDGAVKLCDFGIAKAAALGDSLTNPGQVKGKYAYMSPEQTIAAPLDGRSDVFSLAIVLWELLANRYIVPRGDAVEAMRAIRDGNFPPLSVAAPDVPSPLAEAIAWALEVDPDDRATAADLAQALEAFIKSSPELATPMQLAQWVRARFPRETTAPQRAVPGGTSTRTAATKGTLVSPPTVAGDATIASAPPTMTRAALDPAQEPSGPRSPLGSSSFGAIAQALPPNDPNEAPTLPRPHKPVTPTAAVQALPIDRSSPPSRVPRIALAIASLAALAVFSFLIALAARGRGRAAAPRPDAVRTLVAPADAAPG
jgi:serine/threonine-protein kinase